MPKYQIIIGCLEGAALRQSAKPGSTGTLCVAEPAGQGSDRGDYAENAGEENAAVGSEPSC